MHVKNEKYTNFVFNNINIFSATINAHFYSSAHWARRVIFVHNCRDPTFDYYANMVQQIEFIIHTNIELLPAIFFTQGQGFKKILVQAITWKE